MKVILTAFNGKLKSEPMDWPENTPPNINMIMSISRINPHMYKENIEVLNLKPLKKGTFETTGKYFTLPGNETAAEYV